MGKTYDDDVVSPDDMVTDGYAGEWDGDDSTPEDRDEIAEAVKAEAEEAAEAEAEPDKKAPTTQKESYLTKPHGAFFQRLWDYSTTTDHDCRDFDPETPGSLCTSLKGLDGHGCGIFLYGGIDEKRVHIGAAELISFFHEPYYTAGDLTTHDLPKVSDKVVGLINDLADSIYDYVVDTEIFRRTNGHKKPETKEIVSAARRYAKEIVPQKVKTLPLECIVPLSVGFFGLHLIDTSDGDESSEAATKVGYYDDGSQIFHISGRDTAGTWVTDDLAVNRLFRLFDPNLTDHTISKIIIPQIRTYLSGYEPRNRKANVDPFLIPCKNGVFNWKTKVFREFSREDTFLWKLRVPYNPDAKNPMRDLVDIFGQPTGEKWYFDSWILDLFEDSSLPSADSQRRAKENSKFILQQWLPYMLTPSHSWDKSFIFCSEQGSGGKGCLLLLIRNIIGDRSIAEIKLADFDKNFSLQELYEYNKRVIVSEENPVRTFIDAAALYKALITGDFTSIMQKFKSTVTARIRASQTHCVNEIPRVADTSDSYVRRHLFLRFHKNFHRSGEHKEIKQRFLCDPEVLEYVLKQALEAPYREALTPTESMGEVLREFQTLNNPMVRFWEDIKDFMDANVIEIPTDCLYPIFQRWYKENVRGSSGYGSAEYKKMMRDVVYNDASFEYDTKACFKTGSILVSDTVYALYDGGWITCEEVDMMLSGRPKSYRGSIRKRRLIAGTDNGKIGVKDAFGKVIRQYVAELPLGDDKQDDKTDSPQPEAWPKTIKVWEEIDGEPGYYIKTDTGKRYYEIQRSEQIWFDKDKHSHVALRIFKMDKRESPVI